MANNIDDVIAQLGETVTAVKGVLDQATAFVLGVPALIQAAVDEARQAGATEEQLSAFATLKTNLEQETTELAQALSEVSPPAPAPPVE